MSAYFPLKANIIQRTSQEHSVSSCPTVKKDTVKARKNMDLNSFFESSVWISLRLKTMSVWKYRVPSVF